MNILKSCPDATITVNSDQLGKAVDTEINKRCGKAIDQVNLVRNKLVMAMNHESCVNREQSFRDCIEILDSIRFEQE